MLHAPRALVWRVGAIVVGVVTAAVVTGDVRALHAHAHDLGAPRPVVVARRDLALGHRIAADDIEVVTRYASQVSERSLRTVADATGRVVVLGVAAGAPVLPADLAGASSFDEAVPSGDRVVRVADAQSLRPAPGSVVDVLVAARDGADAGLASLVVAGAVVVDGPRRADEVAASGTGDTVALLVPARELSRLASALARGQIVLALAPPEEACCPSPSG